MAIKAKKGKIITDLYCKPTDGHQYLHYDSRIRGYPDYLIKEQVEKALRLTASDENNRKKVNGVPLVVTYNPAFKNLFQVIRKNLQLLYAEAEVKKVSQKRMFFNRFKLRNNIR